MLHKIFHKHFGLGCRIDKGCQGGVLLPPKISTGIGLKGVGTGIKNASFDVKMSLKIAENITSVCVCQHQILECFGKFEFFIAIYILKTVRF
jgi:hypothetical protein